ncbi:MAG: hypothetical protein Q9190_006070 [Brigantiaea leucoxantha]
MAITESPYKSAKDSPSRQLLWELSQLAIAAQEKFHDRLDRDSKEREVIHSSALAAAIAEHERVRRDAETERQRVELQIREEQRKREEERRDVERRRQLLAEEEFAAREEEAQRVQAAKRAQREATAAREAREAREAESARQKAAKDRAEAEAESQKRLKEKEDAETRIKKLDDQKKAQAVKADRKAREALEQAEKARKVQGDQLSIEQQQPTKILPAPKDSKLEAEFERFREIHRKLKELRKYMADQARQNTTLKDRMGDMRREIKKSVGQLTEGKGANKQQRIVKLLKEAVTSFPQPSTSLAVFIARPVQDAQAPALVIYLLNHFAKAVVSQYINEASVSPKLADPIGTIASSIFAMEEFKCNGVSLIDVLIAKLHVVCPPLFGIYGDENTTEGRNRLGWWREEPGGSWVSDQRHWDRMAGLGAGFASIALRNFEKSRNENPYPPFHYWQSLSLILNIPAGHVTETHCILLRSMISNNESRFLQFFGNAGTAALRYALLDFPKKVSRQTPAASSLAGLEHLLRKEKGIYL